VSVLDQRASSGLRQLESAAGGKRRVPGARRPFGSPFQLPPRETDALAFGDNGNQIMFGYVIVANKQLLSDGTFD
jgi:hypothetical protein